MKKNIFILIIVCLLLTISVSAISKYYSPIVTGQDIENEGGFAGADILANNLILGTSLSTTDKTTFSTCQFTGSGDQDYRYANVDNDGLIYLTDDDFIHVFNDDCALIATHTINGTLMSQPYIYDSEGDGFKNIFYVSAVGTISQLNEYEMVDGVIVSPVPNQISLREAGFFCAGLYCDRSSNECVSLCKDDASGGFFSIISVNPSLSLISSVNVDIDFAMGFGTIYDEANNNIRIDVGAELFDVYDRTYPAIYGMDIDQDGGIEVGAMLPSSSPSDIIYTMLDLQERNIDSEGTLISNAFTPNVDVFGSGGLFQLANFGSLNSNGEMFLSYMQGVLGAGTIARWEARVFNSVGSVIRTVIDDASSTYTTFKQSNFAVSQVDGDLRNDYCIAFNNTRRNNLTVIECYSGLTNSIMTNCTISGWGTDNPIHLSLLNWDTTNSVHSEAITTFGIFDLSENSGGECTNLRPEGFTGLTSASEGVMLPVAVGGDFVNGNRDTLVDLLYYGADGARLFKTQIVSGVGGTGTQSGLLCGASHIIFCDNFNYEFGLTQRDWQVLERDGEINTTITPEDNRLNSTDIKFQSFVHETVSVDVNYTISEVGIERRIILSFVHPVVSHSFKLNVVDNNGLIEFRIDDRDLQPSIQMRIRGRNITVVNESTPTLESVICENCVVPNITNTVKVTQFFGNDNAKEQGEAYPFNISIARGFYRIFINNELQGDNIFFTNNASFDASTWLFTKNKDIVTGFTLDDVFSYRGTSQIIDNSDDFFSPIVEDVIFECQIENLFCAETSECCSDLTCESNLCRATTDIRVDDTGNNSFIVAIQPLAKASNLSLGTWWLMFMLVGGIVVFIGSNIIITSKGGDSLLLSFLIFLIVEFLALVIGARVGLLSVGIVITITVVALVIVGVFVFKWFSGVGNG